MLDEKDYWNTEELVFQNFKIKQLMKMPTDSKQLIMFINNEDRATGSLSGTTESLGVLEKVHLIVLRKKTDSENKPEMDELIKELKILAEFHKLEFYTHYLDFYSEEFSQNIYKLFAEHSIFDERVLFDITCCPPAVMIPMSEVMLGHQKHTVTFVYSIPERYDVKLIQEIGAREAEGGVVKEYGNLERQQTTLAIVAGFEDKKAHDVVDHVNPDFGYLFNNIFDNDLTQSALAKTTMKLHHDILKLDKFKQFHLPRYDVNRMINTFGIIDKTKENHNLVMACFGSKIQRLAVMLFVSLAKNRQLVDIIPNQVSFDKVSSGYQGSIFYSISRINQ